MGTEATSELPRHRRSDRTIEDVRLSHWQRWPMLAILVTIFLVGGKAPVWHNPFDIDRAIWLSYAPIPILVATCLAWSKRLSMLTLFLNTLEIVLTKFALTYCIAIPLWAAFGSAPKSPVIARPVPTVNVIDVQAPPPTPWPANQRASITGRVIAEGSGEGGVFVYVSAGLEEMDFARPSEARIIEVDEQLADSLTVVRQWQPLAGRSRDGQLHTLFIESDHRSRNVPLLPSGETSAVRVHDLAGMMGVRCAVHRHRAHLVVLHHPFSTRTNATGAFELIDVPALPLTIRAWTAKREASLRVELSAGDTHSPEIRLDDP